MKSGVPWNVLGVSPETRDVAREAARRSGMPLGEWLDLVIGDSVRDEDVHPQSHHRTSDDDTAYGSEHSLAAVNQRLNDITLQLDRLARVQPPVPPPPPPRQSNGGRDDITSQRLAEAVARLDSRLDQLITERRNASNEIERRISAVDQRLATPDHTPAKAGGSQQWNGIDQALAEIAARQRALDGEPPAPAPMSPSTPAPTAAPMPAPPRYADPVPRSPTQDVARLEQQLRRITERIETLHRPCAFEEAAGSLRAQLSEIGQSIHDALPRRALEALENEVRQLAGRIDQTRQSGADVDALSGIERGLAEVRDALRGLTPAESLVGFDGAVNTLSHKIDLIAATHQDPEALRQLEAAIGGLHGIVSHVASNDALAKLADEVRSLAAKIDHVGSSGGGDAVMALEQRIAALADALESHNRGSDAASPHIEAMINALSEKIERVQLSRGDHVALGHLEDRIVKLVERLDASDTRLGNLEAIERGLVDLLVHLEEMRAGNGAIRSGGPQSGPITAHSHTEAFSKEIADLKQADRRAQDSLEDVHGTIGHVVDRLAKVEENVRAGAAPQTPAPNGTVRPAPADPVSLAVVLPPAQFEPPPAVLAAAPFAEPEASAAASPRPAESRAPPAAPAPRRPIDPNLPPDHPLEPGSGVGRDRASDTPADRVAASAAAVAPAKPPVIPDPGGKPDFIAAARRAAQAAAAEKPEQRHRLAGGPPNPEREPLAQRLTKRMRPLLIGVAVAVIAIGAIHVARNFLTEVGPEISVPPTGKAPAAGSSAIPGTRATSTASSEPQPAGAAKQLGNMPTVPTGSSTVPSAGVLDLEALPRTEPPSEPGPRAAPAATGDVTGSVPLPPPQPAATPPARRPAAAATSEPEPADAPLPAKIGGAPLRVAAANGDPAAAYEVGMRYAEGRGIAPNLKEAARWLERAAKHGLAPAQFRLGGLYEKGQGVRKDLAEARRLYVAAAEKGHGKAMHNLAVLYAEGIDGKPDYRTSAQWFRKAADRGIPDSQYNLGILYARGIGVGQNLAESYKWFALAAREGDKEAAKKRDDVAARLDQQSLTAARLAVQTWTAEPQPAAAIEVKAPPGGWDHAVAPAKPRKPARARPHKGASQSG